MGYKSSDNVGKLKFELIPARAEKAIAEALTYGANKYGPRDWEERAMSGKSTISEYIGSIRRHLSDYTLGEDHDRESGLHHLICAAVNCMILYEISTKELAMDDRTRFKERHKLLYSFDENIEREASRCGLSERHTPSLVPINMHPRDLFDVEKAIHEENNRCIIGNDARYYCSTEGE